MGAVLPQSLKTRLVSELDKRLDIDIDELLESPKLRVKLSPAELDQSLLKLYDAVSAGPGGDILRVIGGGGSVGLQNFYMRRHAERERWQRMKDGRGFEDLFPKYVDDDSAFEEGRTASQLVRWSLKKNVPRIDDARKKSVKEKRKTNHPSMCFQYPSHSATPSRSLQTWTGFRPPARSCKFSLLI